MQYGDSKDLGFVFSEDFKGKKITLNYWYGKYTVHLRDYIMDGDTGMWYPTKNGITIPAEYAEIAGHMFLEAGNAYAEVVNQQIKDKQLSFDFDAENGEE